MSMPVLSPLRSLLLGSLAPASSPLLLSSASAWRSVEQQNLDAGECSTSGPIAQRRALHASRACWEPSASAASSISQDEDKEEPKGRERKHMFVSQLKDIERQSRPKAPFVRDPIFFPDITLQMMRLPDRVLDEIRRTGWTREVAFKTTPNVTKLEIKAYLEAVYGLKVERVATINYLGKKHLIPVTVPGSYKYGKLARPRTYREDDWKKAYVTFVPPPWAVREQLEKQQGQQGEGEEAERGQEEEGVALASSQQPESPLTMLKMIRKVKLGRGKGKSADFLTPEEGLELYAELQKREEEEEAKAGKKPLGSVGPDGKPLPEEPAAAAPAVAAGSEGDKAGSGSSGAQKPAGGSGPAGNS